MRKIICLKFMLIFLLFLLPITTSCQAAETDFELEYLNSFFKDRDIDTYNLHFLKKISQKGSLSAYRGVTVTRTLGDIFWENKTRDSAAVGIGPIWLKRYEKGVSGKLSLGLDASGGFIIYNESFPPGGYFYNFMWRLVPKLIYNINATTSLSAGYTFMHVSNGMGAAHNPAYNARGVSVALEAKF
ncbi:MAG: acyloxyacyl hydrolase [Sporomusaceae bacterium]|jgi:hypothetical protein|nr:acyloxyacyl hydrolase [Sporomusaceae bacterium]